MLLLEPQFHLCHFVAIKYQQCALRCRMLVQSRTNRVVYLISIQIFTSSLFHVVKISASHFIMISLCRSTMSTNKHPLSPFLNFLIKFSLCHGMLANQNNNRTSIHDQLCKYFHSSNCLLLVNFIQHSTYFGDGLGIFPFFPHYFEC